MKLHNWMSHLALTSTVFSTAVVAQSPNCGWQTIDLDPDSPTYNPTGTTCANGKCCSKEGFCTSSTSDCQAGCQSAFGICDSPLCGIGASDSDVSVCWHESQCCSAEGFCGTDEESCGIGCQYGNCKNIPHWIDNNPPPSIPEYTASVCMANAYNHFHDHGDKHPVCTAKDVHSFTADLVGNENPSSCKKGEIISVYYTAGFTTNSAKGRHDIAMYTALDALCHGDAPSPNDGNCANDGASCTVTVLGDQDIELDKELNINSRIKFADKKGGIDSCADIDSKGEFYFAPRRMEIPCEGKYENGQWTDKVHLQACLSWRQPGADINCDEYGAFPGTTSKCACEFIELDIDIISPTSSPTNMPSAKPSENPTVEPSASPTAAPTSKPSHSPSSSPSQSPSKEPSASPSVSPSYSPSAAPSTSPSLSPSLSPTASPSTSPSQAPSASPSASPSMSPSLSPSVSPTANPSMSPSLSPSVSPTASPSMSPSLSPSVSPTASPSASPSQTPSASPSANPSTSPSHSPTASPTLKPTASSELGNRVWNDLNANGIQDPDEPGIPNVQVILYNQDSVAVSITRTGDDGYYRFGGLVPGEYSVHFTLPSGYKFTKSADVLGDLEFDIGHAIDGSYHFEDVTSDAHVETGNTNAVQLQPGEVNLSLDAGVYIPAKINGFVWHDLNANGVYETDEMGISGVTVILYNDDDDQVATIVSDSSGYYIFDDLMPDTYYAEIRPPTDYILSPTTSDSDFDPSSKRNNPVTIQSGEENRGSFDAGLYMLASVGDWAWLDLNANGIQDQDEGGFPFPIVINLYNSNDKELLSTYTTDETGAYMFEDLIPGTYELEFILEEGDVLSIPFKGNDVSLDSNVNPDTNKAVVTLISGEVNIDVDAGIIADAPYYPEWTYDIQVCTNDGFDPDWMSQNEGRIYLYRNKEECCQNHFWWRMTQCMANEQYKFYRNGEMCDVKIDFDFWQGEATWDKSTLFDTKDECCANLFYYDFSGCMERSPVDFKFDFCLDLASLVPPMDCQTADIYANVIEDVMNLRLGGDSDANITRVGDVSLGKIAGGAGSTTCGGSLDGQDFINDNTGRPPDLSNPPSSTTVCGVISTRSYNCTQEDCLMAKHDSLVQDMTTYVNDGSMTTALQSRAHTRLPPVPELEEASSIPGTFSAFDLLLPATISASLGEAKYFKDNQSCGTKTAFASWETPYDSLLECCDAHFNWKLDECCAEGGGCDGVSNTDPSFTPDSPPVELYYATWTSGSLCDKKNENSFDSWETPYTTLKDCCQMYYDTWGSKHYDDCCATAGLGGCV